tara:strand:+ start:14030 stop:14920 length:891 start_codon:yes stop_codon:yes gene_type:complete
MLSILIPIYNYNAYPLVQELQKQCMECEIDFEILCQDDLSSEYLQENQNIKTIENTEFQSNNSNLGRGKNINILSQKAQFNYLLILDCDTFPKDSSFIKNYLEIIQREKPKIVFGGILYEAKRPRKEQLLRWIYGNKREAIPVEIRKKTPNKNALTSNLLVKTTIFIKYPFDDAITKYGYEDLCFLSVLESNEISVTHIENPTYHLNLETSLQFLIKTKIAIENLALLIESKKIAKQNSRLFSSYVILRKLKLTTPFGFLFNKTEGKITTNLLSQNPSVFLFDLFKLGYLCKIKNV